MWGIWPHYIENVYNLLAAWLQISQEPNGMHDNCILQNEIES